MSDGSTGKRTIVAGVDLGGTKIQTVVLKGGTVAGESRVPTPDAGVDAVVQAIAETVQGALADAGADPSELAAVGIGTPGEVQDGTVSRAWNVPGFGMRVELGPLVSKALDGVQVTLENDVRAAVLGERRRGAGRPFRNFIGVFVGTGVGGGIVLDGTLREGLGAAGEIGHTVVKDRGRKCGCGRRGCLEAYAGRASMEATARRWVEKKGRSTILFDLMKEKGRDRLTSGVIAAALEKDDGMAKRLIDDAVWALGLALASTQNLLDLEAIIVGGGLGDRLGQPFVDRIAESMQPRLFVPEHAPAMLTTQLGDLSGAVGAAVGAGG
jgi:glucokinase